VVTHDATGNRRTDDRPVPKVCGADAELANFVLGLDSPWGTGSIASKLLLRHVPGVGRTPWATSAWNYAGTHAVYSTQSASGEVACAGCSQTTITPDYDPQDWGRKFLSSNGGSAYIDLDHLELCTPEVHSAHDHVAAWYAMLRIARRAQQAVNAALDDGLRVEVLVNNSDGLGNAYAGHLSFLVSRRCFDNIFHRKIHHMLYLASYQASSIVITGQGKVGAEHGAPPVDYQLSQRADFFETVSARQTTYRRPMVNSRDKALCADLGGHKPFPSDSDDRSGPGLARLHVIFYDSNLCHVACLLKVGVMQIALAMLEAQQIDPTLILDDPLDATLRWSHDPTLRARALTAAGEQLTAVEWQLRFLEEAERFCRRGGCDGVVPRAGEILALYADTLEKLHAGDFDALTGRLDWVLKLRILDEAMAAHAGLSWNCLEVKHLDHLYSALDPEEGLYWHYERAGLVEPVVDEERIERFVHHPPDETRAWTRAMLLRLAGPDTLDQLDWDSITFKEPDASGWPVYRTLKLSHPLGLSRAATAHLFGPGRTLSEVLDALLAAEGTGCVSNLTWPPSTGQAYDDGPALLAAPYDTAASGSDPAAVYAYGSLHHGHLEQEGEQND